jgi:hypothetical protein
MNTQGSWLGGWRRHSAAILMLLALPLADADEAPPSQIADSIAELRHSVGLWDVTTTRYGDDGAIAGVATGTYRFDWVVPDRVLAGRSDIPDWQQSSGILFYVNASQRKIEMASVGADGQLWVMSGPASGGARTTPRTRLADGRAMTMRFTRFGVTRDRFESCMEMSLDGGKTWQQGNHQLFVRAKGSSSGTGGGLRDRKRSRQYIPLT